MHTVILARYNESLDWIVEIPDNFNVIIYNKGEQITSPAVLRRATEVFDRPNVGRESETYMFHMISRATDDRYFTVFSQGDPSTHSPDFIEILRNWRKWDDVQSLSWQWREDKNIPPRELLNRYRENFPNHLRIRPEIFSLINWSAADFMDIGAANMGLVYKTVEGVPTETTNIAAHVLNKWKLHEQAEKASKHSLGVFSYGAIFAVRNELIARLPKESKELIYDFTMSHIAAYGYIMERMWLHIFGEDFFRRIPVVDDYSSILTGHFNGNFDRAEIARLVTNLIDQGLTVGQVEAFVKESMRHYLDLVQQKATGAAA